MGAARAMVRHLHDPASCCDRRVLTALGRCPLCCLGEDGAPMMPMSCRSLSPWWRRRRSCRDGRVPSSTSTVLSAWRAPRGCFAAQPSGGGSPSTLAVAAPQQQLIPTNSSSVTRQGAQVVDAVDAHRARRQKHSRGLLPCGCCAIQRCVGRRVDAAVERIEAGGRRCKRRR